MHGIRPVLPDATPLPSLDSAASSSGAGPGGQLAARTAPNGVVPISQVAYRDRAVVEGRIRSVRISPISGSPALMAELCDATGGVTLVFYGRRSIAGLEPGTPVRAEGRLGEHDGHLAMANPTYRLLPHDDAPPGSREAVPGDSGQSFTRSGVGR